MSAKERSGAAPARIGEADREREVAEYLAAHPDFFERHPELIAELVVPHACGEAVSLVEHQVGVLRGQARELRGRLHALVGNARDNEELSQKLHRLTMSLLDAGGIDEILARLHQSLREDLAVEFSAVRLLAPPRAAADARLGEFVADREAARAILAGVLGADRPVCGQLRPEQAELLFTERWRDVGSAAAMPLGTPAAFGVLAVGSADPGRYQPGMGTLCLRQLGELVARVLARHVEAR